MLWLGCQLMIRLHHPTCPTSMWSTRGTMELRSTLIRLSLVDKVGTNWLLFPWNSYDQLSNIILVPIIGQIFSPKVSQNTKKSWNQTKNTETPYLFRRPNSGLDTPTRPPKKWRFVTVARHECLQTGGQWFCQCLVAKTHRWAMGRERKPPWHLVVFQGWRTFVGGSACQTLRIYEPYNYGEIIYTCIYMYIHVYYIQLYAYIYCIYPLSSLEVSGSALPSSESTLGELVHSRAQETWIPGFGWS
jgi:hypothetical protein